MDMQVKTRAEDCLLGIHTLFKISSNMYTYQIGKGDKEQYVPVMVNIDTLRCC